MKHKKTIFSLFSLIILFHLYYSVNGQRKYDYTYDNAGRLTKADFREKKTPGDSWNNTKLDFSVGGNTGAIQYDLNGNLLSMLQKGIVIGGAGPMNVDNLAYNYITLSNKLTKVTDNGTLGANNGALGDFKDGANAGDDYAYDNNGNLIIDLNKNATGVTGGVSTPIGTSGITYNFLDKPELIRIPGKGTIQIIYDADGNKLQRMFTPETGAAKTTTYINEFVYQGDSLQYINFEEGRIRVLTAVSTNNGFDGLAIDGNMDLPDSKRGAYDYFIRDYQQNVRMILTEETHYGINECTMESARAGNEEPYFGQAGGGNEVAQTRTDISLIPGQTTGQGWHSNTSSSVSKLDALTHKAGPNVLLKVMAGDQINATASYYYQNPVTNGTGNNLTTSIVTALAQTILGSPITTTVDKGNTSPISTDLNADGDFISKTAPDANNAAGTNPKAYLTVVFFNERFEYVSEGSMAVRVAAAGDGQAPLVIPNVKAPKNGYAYIYLSNESNEPVYFDDFKVADTRGRIIEENHYYAFGLRIDGISSRKLDAGLEGSLKNNNLYNDKELWDDADLDWYDYGFRDYDPQMGRFPQLDPLTNDYPELTPYQYAGNEPIANVDLDGLEPLPSVLHAGEMFNLTQTLQPVVITAKLGAATKSLSFAAKAGIFFKGVGTGINLATDWINHNVNPVYLAFNGINSQFTHQDFLNGTPMTHAEGATDAAFALVPGEGALFRPFEKLAVKETEQLAVKGTIETANGIKLTGFTKHGVDRAIGNFERNGVKPNAILDAIKNPLKIKNVVTDQFGRQSQRFIGKFGEVVVNPQTGKIISVNPTSTRKAAKLLKQLGQ